ncbi:MAG: Fic family protein [Elusimicrobia bacterium]|nr:Fic family protein [Elusimicrobiota bacterium]
MERLKYIWQSPVWPAFRWKAESLLSPLSHVRLAQGALLQKLSGLGIELTMESESRVLTAEVIKTAAIEGEQLDPTAVRSSVARRLGLPSAGLPQSARSIDGLVDVLLDATLHFKNPLTSKHLKGWQAALFPTGYSGFHKIRVGQWRGTEPMRVISGPMGHERIHFEAPPQRRLPFEMSRFLKWWNQDSLSMDGLLRAGVGHFYFVTIHPFEDGNGRIARALTDMALAQDEKTGRRCYSMSTAIMDNRSSYYDVLESCSKGSLDITPWLLWFLTTLADAIRNSDGLLSSVLTKARFWQDHVAVELSPRQRKALNAMLDCEPQGFAGGMTTRKFVGMTRASRATAFRELAHLVSVGILKPASPQGRSTAYHLVLPQSTSLKIGKRT